MSTPFVFSDELPELYTVAAGDILMLWDTSAGLMKRSTVSQCASVLEVSSGVRGASAATVIGFYGETGVNRASMAGTAITSLTTAVISVGNAAGTWAWASSTMAAEFVTRAKQAQTDLKTLMQKLDSV